LIHTLEATIMANCKSNTTAFTTADAEIDSPCPGGGPEFADNERISFCNLCSKNVHNLSGMTEAEARDVIDTDEDICISYVAGGDHEIEVLAPSRRNRIGRFLSMAAAMSLVIVGQTGCADADDPSNAKAEKRGFISKLTRQVSDIVSPSSRSGKPTTTKPRMKGGKRARQDKVYKAHQRQTRADVRRANEKTRKAGGARRSNRRS
jgi:hypothetical protein